MAAETSNPALALGPVVGIGIVGAGAMGAGIAQVAVVAGHRVLLFDNRPGAAEAAIESIVVSLERLVARDRMSPQNASTARVGLRATHSLAGLAGCGLVIEAIVEDLEAKRALLRELEGVVGKTTILATNTSSISVTAIGAGLRHPERLAGMHFFNPAPVMPLVEVVSGARTAASVSSVLHATAIRWGKVPVHARSSPGFIVNRVARPFYGEALRVLAEGATDCATIDAVLRECGGFRMGPFELMDLIGNDINYAVTRSVFEAFYGDPRFAPSLIQLELVEAGRLGRKTGRGFYDYSGDPSVAGAKACAGGPAPIGVVLFGNDPLAVALSDRLKSVDISLERKTGHVDGRTAECNGCTIYRTDGRTATARAAASRIHDTVVVDLALDEATAKRLAVAVADQADPGTLGSVAGLLHACGYAVSAIDDVPGMIVLRTVAMLVNEAADAVHQGVCSVADCDLAMRKGVNYPLGPLEWADRIGLTQIVTGLDHLDEAYGDGRYRVSPLLRRKALADAMFDPAETSHVTPADRG